MVYESSAHQGQARTFQGVYFEMNVMANALIRAGVVDAEEVKRKAQAERAEQEARLAEAARIRQIEIERNFAVYSFPSAVRGEIRAAASSGRISWDLVRVAGKLVRDEIAARKLKESESDLVGYRIWSQVCARWVNGAAV